MKNKLLPIKNTGTTQTGTENSIPKGDSNMVKNQQSSIEVDCTKIIKMPKCAGRNCENLGIKNLRIVLFKKTAWFCQKCADELTNLDLVEQGC